MQRRLQHGTYPPRVQRLINSPRYGHFADKLYPNNTILIMPNKTCHSESTKMGTYGSFIFPERAPEGFWRLQTDFPPLLEHLKERDWDAKSPWKTVGWGTSYIFRRDFSGAYEAKRSVKRIFARIGYPEIVIRGSVISLKALPIHLPSSQLKKAVSGAYWQETPPLSGKNQESASDKSSEKEGVFR